MSQTANDEASPEDAKWSQARGHLFRMIMEGRSFSGKERNCLFLNRRGKFANISAVSGVDFPDDGRSIAVTDWDGDGDQDFWISNRNAPRLRLMQNHSISKNQFIAFRLEGNGKTTNRDGIGARVEVFVKPNQESTDRPLKLVRTLRAGEGFLSQSSKRLHFGLGATNDIEKVVVSWPGGTMQTFSSLQPGRCYQLTQTVDSARELTRKMIPTFATKTDQSQVTSLVGKASDQARVLLQSRVPMPSIHYRTGSDDLITETFATTQPTFVNLWASWCQNCIRENNELNNAAQRLSKANVRVVSLSIDKIGDKQGKQADVEDFFRSFDYQHAWGFLQQRDLNRITQLHHFLFFLRKPLPLPTSFLIDKNGRLAVIYRGPVSVDQLLADCEKLNRVDQGTIELAACLPGSTIDHARVRQIEQESETHSRYLIATWLEESESFDDAFEHFSDLARVAPEWSVPYRHLARLSLLKKQLKQASNYAQRALAIDPNDGNTYNTLGLIHDEGKSTKQAEFHFRSAIRLAPNLSEAHNNLGSLLAASGRLSEAQTCFQRAIEIDDSFVQARVNLGSVFMANSKFKQAMAQYRKALEYDPNYVDAHTNLGTAYAQTGDLRMAIQCYERALKIDPRNSNALNNLNHARKLLK